MPQPMRRVLCLHTARSNIAVFDSAFRDLGVVDVALAHIVRSDLLEEAERAGGLTPPLRTLAAEALEEAAATHDAVLLTCSTLGPVIDGAGRRTGTPIMRADEAMARQAVERGGLVAALSAVRTTVQPTTELFTRAARATGARVDVRFVANAWEAFRAGDLDTYAGVIAREAEAAFLDGAETVALAQASMAPAADLVMSWPRPLGIPKIGLTAAIAAVVSRQ